MPSAGIDPQQEMEHKVCGRSHEYGTPFLQVAMALCTVLSACLGRIPDSLVRSKFVSCSTIVMEVIERQKDQVMSGYFTFPMQGLFIPI